MVNDSERKNKWKEYFDELYTMWENNRRKLIANKVLILSVPNSLFLNCGTWHISTPLCVREINIFKVKFLITTNFLF